MQHHTNSNRSNPFFLFAMLFFSSIFACSNPPAKIPGPAEQDMLVKQNLLAFSKAVMANQFVDFHSTLSTPFKKQFSPDDLQKVFHAFVEQKIDLALIKPMTPIYSEPARIDQDGVLSLVGYFDTSPSLAYFELNFYEYPAWKLLKINVKVNSDPSMKLPSSEFQETLVKDSLQDFALAINKADFTAFHSHLCANFRNQYTAEDLQKAFQGFIDQKIDLTVLADKKPIFHQNPYLNKDDILILTGHYDVDSSEVNFVLKFYERPDWKLLSINVNIK